jgi:hypothetical protein
VKRIPTQDKHLRKEIDVCRFSGMMKLPLGRNPEGSAQPGEGQAQAQKISHVRGFFVYHDAMIVGGDSNVLCISSQNANETFVLFNFVIDRRVVG